MLHLRISTLILVLATVLGVNGTVATGTPEESSEKIYQKTLKSTAWVLIPAERDGNKVRLRSGSGSLIDAGRRLVLTNYHVVGNADKAQVLFPIYEKNKPLAEKKLYFDHFSRGETLKGKVIASDPKRDLALIQLEALPPNVPALKLAKDSVNPAQRIHSIGNPGASDALWVYTPGTVRQVYRKTFNSGSASGGSTFKVDAKVVETQSAVNSGDSGGPVVNDQCELVAVVQGHIPDAQARLVSYFIDISEVRSLLVEHKLARPLTVVASKPDPAEKPAAAEKPKVETTADTAGKDEEDAARKLKLAKALLDDGKTDKAAERFAEIARKYPKTKAGAEAKTLLEKYK